jgi:hypothetical protein
MRAYRTLAIMITEEIPGNSRRLLVAKPIELEERDECHYGAEPSLRIPMEEGQHLIDQLWEAGYRPSVGVSSQGEAEAHRAHIADLRSVVDRILPAGKKE